MDSTVFVHYNDVFERREAFKKMIETREAWENRMRRKIQELRNIQS